MAILDLLSNQRLTDANGNLLPGAKISYWADVGASTPLAVYSDANLSSARTQPVVADAGGMVPPIFLQAKRYWRTVTTSADVAVAAYSCGPIDKGITRIYSESEPSPTYAGLQWVKISTNILSERNSTNTAWLSRGDVDSQNARDQDVNAQTGTSYTIDTEDRGKLLTLSNTSAIAVTLPQANSSTFAAGWFLDVRNLSTGAVTITPTTSTIGGRTTLVLGYGDSVRINSDGTNYQIHHLVRSRNIVKLNEAATLSLAHTMKKLLHDEATARVWTIPGASLPTTAPFDFECDIVNDGGTLTLSITGGTLQRSDGIPGTGTRTIASSATCTLSQISSTVFVLSGAFT